MTPMPYADLGNGAPGRNARAADQSRYCPRRRKPGRRGEACCTWQRLFQESMNRWACPILSEGPTTLLDESSAGSFAFLDVRYEKSENGLPWVSYGVGKAERGDSPPIIARLLPRMTLGPCALVLTAGDRQVLCGARRRSSRIASWISASVPWIDRKSFICLSVSPRW